MLPAKQISLWADKLRDISATGLMFSNDIYDRERSEKIQEIAMSMLAFTTGTTFSQLHPLRENLFSQPTPLIGGDAAIINGSGNILLIQRSDNKLWAMTEFVGQQIIINYLESRRDESHIPYPAGQNKSCLN